MKWRSALVYLVVLLVLGGYFGYFEVVQKDRKEAQEREAKQVFHLKADALTSVSIISKDKPPVELKKSPDWQITAPITAAVDPAAVEPVLGTLAGLERSRDVTAAPPDLAPYGLKDPALTVRFAAGEQSFELLLGDKTPVGDARYAKTGDKPDVFLVPEGEWGVLNKGANDFRKRELFAFEPSSVTDLTVSWQDGATVHVDKQGTEGAWKAPESPESVIKKSKVDGLIEQIHWLRAQKFLEDAPKALEPYGLEPAAVQVALRLASGQTVELRLGTPKEGQKLLSALSSELPAVVQIDSGILKELPKTVSALEDRSLLGVKGETIQSVTWSRGEAGGDLVRLKENEWGVKKEGQTPEPMADSWHVMSLLWDVGDLEYQQKVTPTPPAPEKPFIRLTFSDGQKPVATLSWQQSSGDAPVTVWIEKAGQVEAVQVDRKEWSRVEEDVARFTQPEPKAS